MESPTSDLRTAVKERLIPYIQKYGFEPDDRPIWKQDPYGHLVRRFLRRNADKLELLEIQFDKHGRAAFVFNLGVVPPEGVITNGEHKSPEKVAVMHLPEQARLYASRAWRMRWFGFPWIRIPLLRSPTADQIIERAIQLFPQVEAWLKNGIEGSNVRVNRRVIH